MKKITLVFPTANMERDAEAFKEKFYSNGEKTISGSFKFDTGKYSYPEWLKIIQNNATPKTANPKFGISDTLFAIDEGSEIVGIINIRYDMTDFYKDSGHIGYSVVPDKRRQGYASEMLKDALLRAKAHGLSEVKLVCAVDNIASIKTILSCQGMVNRMITSSTGDKVEYIITL